MNQKLREKVLSRLAIFAEGKPADETADAILALFASSLVKAQRESFVAGADWAVGEDYGDMGIGESERAISEYASRRYPDA